MNKASSRMNSISEKEAEQVIALWEKNFPNVTVIQHPSDGSGMLTLAHGMKGMSFMDVNGLKCRSPLFTMALLSSEVALDQDGVPHYANAYEIMAQNVPGLSGNPSNMSLYKKYLNQNGLDVHSDHYHWKTGDLNPAIHHFGADIAPLDFSVKTIDALKKMMLDTQRLIQMHSAFPQ